MQFCRRGICVNTGCAKSPRQPVARGSPWPRAVLAHIAHRPIRSTGARPVARPGPSGPKRDQPDSLRAEKFYDRHGLTCNTLVYRSTRDTGWDNERNWTTIQNTPLTLMLAGRFKTHYMYMYFHCFKIPIVYLENLD